MSRFRTYRTKSSRLVEPGCPPNVGGAHDSAQRGRGEESDENRPGVILDYDKTGKIVGIEILNASKHIENPKSLEYAVA